MLSELNFVNDFFINYQMYPPIIIPPKVIELKSPLSEEVIFKSHSAVGSTNDTHNTSIASEAFANAQTKYKK